MGSERPIGYAWRVSFQHIMFCLEAGPGTVEIPWAQYRWQAIRQALRILEKKYGRKPGTFKRGYLLQRRTRRASGPIPRPDHVPQQLVLL
jgi:hypothetical protein